MKWLKKTLKIFEGRKTLLYALVNLVLSFIPGVSDWMRLHPEEAMQINAGIVTLLRALTNGSIKRDSVP